MIVYFQVILICYIHNDVYFQVVPLTYEYVIIPIQQKRT